MANWAYTSYRITGKKEHVKDLFSKLENMEKPLVNNDFGKLWLGCLVTALGGDSNDVYCRGYITHFNLNDGILSVETETAWDEMDEVRHFIEKVYKEVKIYYYVEECGAGIYKTNDAFGQFFTQRYIFEDLEGEGTQIFDDAEELLVCASEAMDKKLNTIEDLVNETENNDDYSFYIVKVVKD